MQRSYLIQRLHAPVLAAHLAALGEAFSFGGGRKNGGLTEEAMGLLRNIFSFDYMGASEFEWGAVPEALQRLAKSKTLEAFTVKFPLVEVKEAWCWRDSGKPPKINPKTLAEIFVIAPSEWRDEVAKRIKEFATVEHVAAKEQPYLNRALRPVSDWDGKNKGWLELDNGFFFFIDREMFQNTAQLFGIKVGENDSVVML